MFNPVMQPQPQQFGYAMQAPQQGFMYQQPAQPMMYNVSDNLLGSEL